MKSLTIFLFLPLLICGLLLGNAALTELVYDSSKTYSTGDAVIPSSTEFTLYTAKASVPAGENGPPNTAYWQTAEEYSTELDNIYSDTVSTPPSSNNINTNEIDNLGKPSDLNSSISFWGLAIRGSIGDYPVAGGITIKGSGSKKVMIRVKGPTMGFGGAKVSDPKITITKLNEAGTAYDPYLTVDNWGDHEETATNYPELATNSNKEPVAVLDLAVGTYGVKVSDASGGSGSANVEFYGMEDDTGNGSFFGLAIRGSIGDYPVAGGITIKGSGSKKVMIRVKGPSMGFGGAKVSDPKITITKLNDAGTAYDPYLTVDNWGDHEETKANYPDLATSSTKEPVAVVDLAAGTYGVKVNDASGGSGSANVEFYEQE